jgi:signal transduction histidine kinase/ligand-binding sensor domain-containing protein
MSLLPTMASPNVAPLSSEYVLRTWETDDGLPQNTVTGIAQTPDGYLWLATQGGLARFDGLRFTAFLKGSTPGLGSSYARSLAVDRIGALWIGIERGGVVRMRDGHFETIVPPSAPTAVTAWTSSFAEDAAGAVWIGLAPDQVVYRWQHGQLKKFTGEDGVGSGNDTFVHADTDGHIWYSTKTMCGVFDGTRFQPFDPEGGVRVHLAAARKGGMWAVRGTKVLHYWADGRREEVADLEWLGGAVEVNVVYEDHAGDLWLGTRNTGLLRLRARQFVRVPTSHQDVQAIMEDREGNLWAGTQGGLDRLRPQRFFLRDARNGLTKEGVVSLCEDTERRLWLAVRDSVPERAVDSTNQFFAPVEGPGVNLVPSICADPRGGVWVGQDGGSLLHWRDGAYLKTSTGQRISTLLCDHAGNVWLATTKGSLIRFHDDKEDPVPTEDGRILFRALAEDRAGRIWAGTDDGLVFRRDNDQFQAVPLPGAKEGESIRFLVPDEKETMWIGARDGGLYRWRNGHIDHLPSDGGPSAQDFRALLIEPDGTFWLATGTGLFRTTRQEIESVLDGRQHILNWITYGRDEGLPKVDFTFGRRNGATRTHDGHLWFATSRGALEVSPDPLPEIPLLSPVLIEEMRVDGQPRELTRAGRVTLGPKPGPIELRYTVPRLSSPERVRFRYRLAGLEEDWIDAQNQRRATYTRIPPGSYLFEVVATLDAGSNPTSVAVLPFVVQAAWWETPAFHILAGFLCVLLVAMVVRMIVLLRVRARIRRLEQENALEKERARIARDMHDELGASLTRIALMSEIAADEPEMRGPAAQQLGALAQSARSVSSTLDQIVWTVNPRNDTLERLVGYLAEFAGEYLAPTGLELHLALPADIPAQAVASETRHEVLLATKEALNNAVKYARARRVTLRVAVAKDALAITVADDGCGFDLQAVPEFSNGLIHLRQRLTALGGSAEIVSQPGAGTTITLHVPLEPR